MVAGSYPGKSPDLKPVAKPTSRPVGIVRQAQESDFEPLAGLYREFFPTHNIFQGDQGEVVAYLRQESGKSELLLSEVGGSVKGALFLAKTGQDSGGSHTRWKFRHFAFETVQVAQELLKEAEKRVSGASDTAKVELTIAETEEGLDFYKARGYVQEGVLQNHYRWGERCFVLGKSFR